VLVNKCVYKRRIGGMSLGRVVKEVDWDILSRCFVGKCWGKQRQDVEQSMVAI
jgi:hypothetical protein